MQFHSKCSFYEHWPHIVLHATTGVRSLPSVYSPWHWDGLTWWHVTFFQPPFAQFGPMWSLGQCQCSLGIRSSLSWSPANQERPPSLLMASSSSIRTKVTNDPAPFLWTWDHGDNFPTLKIYGNKCYQQCNRNHDRKCCLHSQYKCWLVLPGAKSVFPKTVAAELQTAQLVFTPV